MSKTPDSGLQCNQLFPVLAANRIADNIQRIMEVAMVEGQREQSQEAERFFIVEEIKKILSETVGIVLDPADNCGYSYPCHQQTPQTENLKCKH